MSSQTVWNNVALNRTRPSARSERMPISKFLSVDGSNGKYVRTFWIVADGRAARVEALRVADVAHEVVVELLLQRDVAR